MWTNVLDKLKNDFHVPIAILVFAVTTVVHVWTKVDLGANYVSSLYALYAFLAGHGATTMWGKVKGNSDDSSSGASGASGATDSGK